VSPSQGPRRARVEPTELVEQQLSKLTAAETARLDRGIVALSVAPELGVPIPGSPLRDYRDDVEDVIAAVAVVFAYRGLNDQLKQNDAIVGAQSAIKWRQQVIELVCTKRVNERTGNEVDFQDIVKGYPVAEGEYVVVEPDELDQISPSRSKTIEVTGFVDLDQVEPVFFDRTYYIGPKGAEFAKIYKLLTDALEASNRAGIALFAMRGKEHLTAVRAHNGLLEPHTMHFADVIRDPRQEIDSLPTGQVKGDREGTRYRPAAGRHARRGV
jgi:hypothetical protein